MVRLQKTLEHIREIDETLIPSTKKDLEKSLSTVSANGIYIKQIVDSAWIKY